MEGGGHVVRYFITVWHVAGTCSIQVSSAGCWLLVHNYMFQIATFFAL